MSTTSLPHRPERYVIRVNNGYLSLTGGHERISAVADVGDAWVFHTHEKALSTARELTVLMGDRHDVWQVC